MFLDIRFLCQITFQIEQYSSSSSVIFIVTVDLTDREKHELKCYFYSYYDVVFIQPHDISEISSVYIFCSCILTKKECAFFPISC